MKKKTDRVKDTPRWMTQCDVIRYNLKIPEEMKKKLKDEARDMGVDMSSYICGVLSGDIKRSKG
jgi:hypothetical protein